MHFEDKQQHENIGFDIDAWLEMNIKEKCGIKCILKCDAIMIMACMWHCHIHDHLIGVWFKVCMSKVNFVFLRGEMQINGKW